MTVEQSTEQTTDGSFRASIGDVVVFCVIIGILATFRPFYGFGLGNQIEHLPTIRHFIRATDFQFDWHVMENSAFGPRWFWFQFMAFMGRIAPLEWICFIGTAISNILTICFSFLFGRSFFRNDRSAMMGAVLVGALNGFYLGGASYLIFPEFIQATMAIPLALFALWSSFRKRLVICLASAALATLIHPVIGLEAGGIAFLAAGGASVLGRRENHGQRIRTLLFSLGGILFLVLLVYSVFLSRMEQSLDRDAFFRILVEFRNPHHYLPSEMGIKAWIVFIGFLFAYFMALKHLPPLPAESVAWLSFVSVGILAALMVGFVFVEIIPIRTFASAQFYRLLFILKWLGLMLFGNSIARWWARSESRWLSALALIGSGPIYPLIMALIYLLDSVRKILTRATQRDVLKLFYPLLALVLVTALRNHLNARESVFLVAMVATSAWFLIRPSGRMRWAIPLLVISLTLPTALSLRQDVQLFSKLGAISLEDGGDPVDMAAFWARDALAVDEVVLVPPLGGRFRLVSGRAIVVDFKSFLFQDDAVLEWYDRFTDVYGECSAIGFPAADEATDRYSSIDGEELRRIKLRYGAGHALLFSSTPSSMPVLFEDANYKLVKIE